MYHRDRSQEFDRHAEIIVRASRFLILNSRFIRLYGKEYVEFPGQASCSYLHLPVCCIVLSCTSHKLLDARALPCEYTPSAQQDMEACVNNGIKTYCTLERPWNHVLYHCAVASPDEIWMSFLLLPGEKWHLLPHSCIFSKQSFIRCSSQTHMYSLMKIGYHIATLDKSEMHAELQQA